MMSPVALAGKSIHPLYLSKTALGKVQIKLLYSSKKQKWSAHISFDDFTSIIGAI